MRESPQAIARDLRRFERIALEQANLCRLEDARAVAIIGLQTLGPEDRTLTSGPSWSHRKGWPAPEIDLWE